MSFADSIRSRNIAGVVRQKAVTGVNQMYPKQAKKN